MGYFIQKLINYLIFIHESKIQKLHIGHLCVSRGKTSRHSEVAHCWSAMSYVTNLWKQCATFVLVPRHGAQRLYIGHWCPIYLYSYPRYFPDSNDPKGLLICQSRVL